jgi:hypothetical protein
MLCVLASFVALTCWSAHPQWYTFISEPTEVSHFDYFGGMPGVRHAPDGNLTSDKVTRLALSIRLPVGWECQEESKALRHTPSPIGTIRLQVCRKPLAGLARWWNQYVLRREIVQPPSETYSIVLTAFPGDFSPVSIRDEAGEMHVRPLQNFLPRLGYRVSFRTFSHPLGPAFEMTRTPPNPITANKRTVSVSGRLYDQSEQTFIAVRSQQHLVITIDAYHTNDEPHQDRFHAVWEEIVRGIRIVQK